MPQIPDIDNSSDLGLKPDSLTGDITFKNVHFCYPSRPDTKVSVEHRVEITELMVD